MKPVDFIIILIVLAVVTAISLYIRKEKKKGSKCIGCPYGASCAAKASGASCSGSCKAPEEQ